MRLGQGSYGTVYKVRHRLLGVQAMKVFRVTDAGPTVEQVIGEALILSKLSDPHVVRVFEANTIDDSFPQEPYMTMEFIAGGTLESLLERRVRLQTLSALKAARQICAGLAAAHRQIPPIVHRDLTAQNVLIDSISPHGTPQVKVADFGLAKHVDPDSRMVRAAGTLAYLAPEAAWGFATPSSDVYSLGVLLYRLLTGVFPFPLVARSEMTTAASARNALLQSRRVEAPPLSRFSLVQMDKIQPLVEKALAVDPHERFRDAVELGRQLDSLLGELTS